MSTAEELVIDEVPAGIVIEAEIVAPEYALAVYAPAADGQSFFVSQHGNRDEIHSMNAVINWRVDAK